MAYCEPLAQRIRMVLKRRKNFIEKKMFGGVGFMLSGNMCCAVWKDSLILRVGPELYEDTLAEPHVRQFDLTGRSMTGWVMVDPDGFPDDESLRSWIDRAYHFCSTLPPKS